MEQDKKQRIPLYSINKIEIGDMTIEEALRHKSAGEMILTTKGHGRNRHYTSCRWIVVRRNLKWKPTESGGFTVMQLCES